MRPISWSTLLRGSANAIARRAGRRARDLVARLAPADVAPPRELPRKDGVELARDRLGEAAAALLGKGATAAEAFRQLRLELNRLEQSGATYDSGGAGGALAGGDGAAGRSVATASAADSGNRTNSHSGWRRIPIARRSETAISWITRARA